MGCLFARGPGSDYFLFAVTDVDTTGSFFMHLIKIRDFSRYQTVHFISKIVLGVGLQVSEPCGPPLSGTRSRNIGRFLPRPRSRPRKQSLEEVYSIRYGSFCRCDFVFMVSSSAHKRTTLDGTIVGAILEVCAADRLALRFQSGAPSRSRSPRNR